MRFYTLYGGSSRTVRNLTLISIPIVTHQYKPRGLRKVYRALIALRALPLASVGTHTVRRYGLNIVSDAIVADSPAPLRCVLRSCDATIDE